MGFATAEIIDETVNITVPQISWRPAELDSEISKNRIRKDHYFEEPSGFKFNVNGKVYQLQIPQNTNLEITDYSQFGIDKIRFRLFINESEEAESFSIEEGLINASTEFRQKYFEALNLMDSE